MHKHKLKIDLIPESSWCKNLRNHIGQTKWNKIGIESCERVKGLCEICGATETRRLDCHEIFEYDEETKIQKLTGFMSLCRKCHQVIHFENTRLRATEGNFELEPFIEHFMKVNNCDRKTFDEHRTKALDIWRKRNKVEWSVDLGGFDAL